MDAALRTKVELEATLDVSIIIMSWNVKDFLRNCLSSIYENTTGISYEIIVVDNASSDNSVEMVENAFPRVVLVANLDNRGFSSANNQGIKIAKGRNILLFNPDTIILDNDLIKEFVRVLDNHAEIGAVGPLILRRDGKTAPLGGARGKTNLWSVLTNRVIEKKIYRHSRFLREKYFHINRYVATVSGACIMVKKEVIEKIGFIDEQFFMFLEDVDYCKRIRDEGYKILYMVDLSIIHFGGESSAKNRERVEIELYRSLEKYFAKHFGTISMFFLKLIIRLRR